MCMKVAWQLQVGDIPVVAETSMCITVVLPFPSLSLSSPSLPPPPSCFLTRTLSVLCLCHVFFAKIHSGGSVVHIYATEIKKCLQHVVDGRRKQW